MAFSLFPSPHPYYLPALAPGPYSASALLRLTPQHIVHLLTPPVSAVARRILPAESNGLPEFNTNLYTLADA
jgi:hypothetical protein